MRIGINALYLIPGKVGGTESYLRNLLRHFQQCDSENEYLVYTNRENAGSFELTQPNFREVPCAIRASSRPARILWEQIMLPRYARRDRIDVLHSPGYTAPLGLGCPSVVTIHDLNYHFFPQDWGRAARWAHRLLIPRVARRATMILTVSHASKESLASVLGVTGSKIAVVHSGVDDNLVPVSEAVRLGTRQKHGLAGEYFLSVVASHPHKNLDGLLLAYDQLSAGWPELPPLVIAGLSGRHHQHIERLVSSRRQPGRIVLTGWVPASELSALYREAALFVFPSLYEGFGFPVLEAMSVGVPVVSSNATSLPKLVGDAGVLVDAADPPAMATAIRHLWRDAELRREMARRGIARAACFTWRRAATETLAVYRRAAGCQ